MISLSERSSKESDRFKYEQEKQFISRVFSLFMIDHESMDKNIILIGRWSKGSITMNELKKVPLWRYEQLVKLTNEISDEEKKRRQEEDESQKSGTNTNQYNPGKYLNQMSGMANKFKK